MVNGEFDCFDSRCRGCDGFRAGAHIRIPGGAGVGRPLGRGGVGRCTPNAAARAADSERLAGSDCVGDRGAGGVGAWRVLGIDPLGRGLPPGDVAPGWVPDSGVDGELRFAEHVGATGVGPIRAGPGGDALRPGPKGPLGQQRLDRAKRSA